MWDNICMNVEEKIKLMRLQLDNFSKTNDNIDLFALIITGIEILVYRNHATDK